MPITPHSASPFAGTSPLLLSVLLGVASLLPFILLVGTSFVKVSVVLGLVRNAIGTQQVPSNMVVMALSAILSLHIMAPTGAAMADAAGPLVARALATNVTSADGLDALGRAWTAARTPAARFLRANASPRDRALFLDLARRARIQQGVTTDLRRRRPLGAPARLRRQRAHQRLLHRLSGVPALLVVDLVIANILVALGMQMVSPSTVSLPFKLLLFIMADGWYLLARALVLGYR
ncbi:MAG: hypothetical protein V9G19_27835 [Tetrasphaera sp.]